MTLQEYIPVLIQQTPVYLVRNVKLKRYSIETLTLFYCYKIEDERFDNLSLLL